MKSNRLKFLLWGIGFGMFFPILGTLLVCSEDGCPDGVVALHVQTRLMQIIDLAPLVLGIFSYSLGINVDRRLASERLAQQTMQEKAALQQDLTQRLQGQNEELHELNRTLEALVYTASHDLKTPVINFESLLTMLRMVKDLPNSAPKIDEIVTRMDSAVARFRTTIDDLLEVSRLELQEGWEPESVSLGAVIAEAQKESRELIEGKNAILHLELAQDEVHGVRHSLVLVVLNLLNNAIQYHEPGRNPEIWIRSRKIGEMVELRIEDNGRGIDLDKQGEKIFKMFTRLQHTETGTGIGLYLVKRSIDKLMGNIRVESELGRGTTFIIELPSTQKI